MNASTVKGQFLQLRDQQDFAKLLGIARYKLIHLAFELKGTEKYNTFVIPKKAGGVRRIAAPTPSLLVVQKRLNKVLQEVYEPKATVNGFVPGRNIVDNARGHRKRKWVLNIDLENFFPTIHYGRVRGLFRACPYYLPKEVAALIGQLCCFNGKLPQGAPTSPVISNMICSRLDSDLRRLAMGSRSYYTRYADDITFSTSLTQFPLSLAFIDEQGSVHVGEELSVIIVANGFSVNEAKVRLQHKSGRQEVTGLTVNEFPNVRRKYVRQVRAMLHAWSKYGLKAAEEEYYSKYVPKGRSTRPPFDTIVKGKLEFMRMVRGGKDEVYLKYHGRLIGLMQRSGPQVIAKPTLSRILLVTEGKTDQAHIRAALTRFQERGRFLGLDIEHHEDEADMGEVELLKFCTSHARRPQPKPVVCLFDCDKAGVVAKVSTDGEQYKNWSNSVYSCALPIPKHREDEPGICIEMLYKDSEITKAASNGRRLFLSTEFNRKTSRLKYDTDISVTKPPSKTKKIIDSDVYNSKGDRLALSKTEFASLVETRTDGFSEFDLSGFEPVFEILELIAGR